MDVTTLTPVTPGSYDDFGKGGTVTEDIVIRDTMAGPEAMEPDMRINLTSPNDQENEVIKVAIHHGPPGILALLRERRGFSWFVVLGLRAIEVCVGPRGPQSLPELRSGDCDPVAFSMQMLEIEMIDEIFLLMKEFDQAKDVQKAGLAIIELLVMDDPEWRDEVARKGGVALLCEIARAWKNSPNIMNQVMTCMSYLAAEDYIEIMLGQHDALEYVAYALRQHTKNPELATRGMLALLNLTVCESHVEEFMDKENEAAERADKERKDHKYIMCVLKVLDQHPRDVHIAIIACGVLANLSVSDNARGELVQEDVFPRIADAMRLEPSNPVLQVACLKSLVNYSRDASHYKIMEKSDIPNLVAQATYNHADDVGVRKYGNYWYGHHTACPIL